MKFATIKSASGFFCADETWPVIQRLAEAEVGDGYPVDMAMKCATIRLIAAFCRAFIDGYPAG